MKKLLPIFTVFALLGTNAFATCTVTYNCGPDATGTPPKTTTYTTGKTIKILANKSCSQEGYDFDKWLVMLNGVGYFVTNPPQSMNLETDFGLAKTDCERATYNFSVTARWKRSALKTYNVSYYPNGGSGNAPTSPTSCPVGDTCIAPANTYTPPAAGYVFNGWRCETSGRICGIFMPGQSLESAAAVDTLALIAQWIDGAPLKTATSKKYVDDEMAKLQPQFAGLGSNKLMTYSSTTNGAVGSRDIVTTLGDSTTDTSVPTIGAINTALATKQNTLNGTAGWVMENTGTAGSVKAKPVYSTTDNYKTALVEAEDLNQIVIDAVNSELTALEGIGWQINTAGNLTLPTLRIMMPDASINGSNYCYRYLSGSNDTDNTCSAATLSTLGARGNKSGLWGAVFDYGDIVGKSVCSATAGTSNTAATDAQESGLTTEFNNQTGVGTGALSDTQMYCWCKMESFAGEPAVSRWVFRSSYASASDCAGNCASACGSRVRSNSAFRLPMFNSVQQ